jgi:alkylation response protein AidB-like acyl-CoA dehydrogenase
MAGADDLRAAARRHAELVVAPGVAGWERTGAFPRDAIREAGRAGLLGLFPGTPATSALPVFEELARADAAYAFLLSTTNAAAATIARSGHPALVERWLSPLASGEAIGGFCLTEPQAGSDAAGIMARLEPDGAGYRLSGTKAWVTAVGEADIFCVACRTGSERGSSDVAIVAVDGSAEGVSVARRYDTMAAPFLPIGDLQLDSVRISAEDVLAAPGTGLQAALAAIDLARAAVAAIAVGLAARSLEIALAHARDRRLAEGTVLDQQAIRFMLADVETGIVAGRLLYEDAARLIGTADGPVAAAHAKRFGPDMALAAATTCAEVLGSNGWRTDVSRLPQHIAYARMLATVDGTTEIQRVIIARALARRAGE